jgi:vacuolar-type H+-ATPase subunit E/Vma4
MAEEIRDLIEKINQEGIKAAEEKAQNIEAAAKQRADDILAQAKLEAGRDLLLSLRKEMNSMLGRIVVSDIRQALTPEALFKLLSEVVRNYNAGESSDITVFLKKEDLQTLEKFFLHKLREETKKKIILMPAEEISGGFTISFDSGKSCYDFTDKALAEYIGTYLKPKLNQILQEAIKE